MSSRLALDITEELAQALLEVRKAERHLQAAPESGAAMAFSILRHKNARLHRLLCRTLTEAMQQGKFSEDSLKQFIQP